MSTEKKHCRPIFVNRLCCRSSNSRRLKRTCVFVVSNRICSELKAQQSDPFSQPSGSSATDEAALCLGSFLYITASSSFFSVFLPIELRPSCSSRTRKRSVPVRVHSLCKEMWFVGACQQARAQPVFDSRHGRVACKTFPKQFTFVLN